MTVVGEHALVAGGAGAIGGGVCARLKRRGVPVSIVDKDIETACRTGDSGTITGFAADVCDADAVCDAFDRAEAVSGTVTRLVVCAGGPGQLRAAADLSPTRFREVFDVHVTAALLLAQEFIARLRSAGRTGNGALVTLGSTTGVTASRNQADYGSAKAALGQLTRVLAVEWAAEGVRANVVAAGQTRTPFVQRMVEQGYDTSATVARTPLGRLAEVDEVAAVVEFLLLDATFVTGAVVPVDGGWTALGR